MKVNLFDAAFSHVDYSVPDRTSRKIQWSRANFTWDGVTIVTDAYLADGQIFSRLKSDITIGWLLEGRAYAGKNYRAVPDVMEYLSFLFTHDQELLESYPSRARFVPFGGSWIPDSMWDIWPKTEQVSIIYSAKRFLPGHRLRHEIASADRMARRVDRFGYGSPHPLVKKWEGLKQYRYSIVVENEKTVNYFTEKLLDCFALGTVPIYWGCPNISDFFDPAGIIPFQNLKELTEILDNLPPKDYEARLPAMRRNLEAARTYVLAEDFMYDHYLKEMDR